MTKTLGKTGWHDAGGWRSLAAAAAFLLVMSTFSLIVGATFLGWLAGVVAAPIAFMSGYCYRERTRAASGQVSRRLQFLVMKEDLHEPS